MTIKREPIETATTATPTHNSTVPLHSMNQCDYKGRACQNPRATKRNGALDELCSLHRSQATNAQRKQKQRERLLRFLVNALQQDDPTTRGMPANDQNTQPRQRPRLVLLGNQQTLILGVVLSDRGAAAAADLAGLSL